MLDGKSILITGGTGSFGQRCVQLILERYKPDRVIIYSRDELKQSQMMNVQAFRKPCMRFFLGDVRDKERLYKAMDGVDYVIHAAALKQVPAAEYNPHEFIKTNINGAVNMVDAALACKVKAVIALSTDKAVNPINLYGATKLCSDKIFITGNSYRGSKPTRFAVVRYGNVFGSRGSVIPIFLNQIRSGKITVTDPRMTRFWITLNEASRFVLQCLEQMVGGELFVPKIPSCTLQAVIDAIAPNCAVEKMPIRPGEKMHETLIPSDEARMTLEFDRHYIVRPIMTFWWDATVELKGKPCPHDFQYSSDKNPETLSSERIREMCRRTANELGMEEIAQQL